MLDAVTLAGSHLGFRTVLVVDGDPTYRQLLARSLAPLAVVACTLSTAESALAWLESNPTPLLISVDTRLPVMSGFRFCVAVRARLLLRDVPLVAVSSRTELQDEAQALEAGVDLYFEKPVVMSEYLRAAKELIEERLNAQRAPAAQ